MYGSTWSAHAYMNALILHAEIFVRIAAVHAKNVVHAYVLCYICRLKPLQLRSITQTSYLASLANGGEHDDCLETMYIQLHS